MNKNEIKKLVPDVCEQKIILKQTVATDYETIANYAQAISDQLETGLICWRFDFPKRTLVLFTSYDFKNFLNILKAGVEVVSRTGRKFTIESFPFKENWRMCVRANGDTWFCDTIYNHKVNY